MNTQARVAETVFMVTEAQIPQWGIPHFIVLHRYCVFYKLKVCGNPAQSKSIGAVFLTATGHFVFLWHILVILTFFQTFIITVV